jgi:hypothetical protein
MSREQDVRDAVDRFVSRVRQETDTQLEALAAELLTVVQGDARTTRLDLERAAVDVARAVARGGAHARHDLMIRIIDAVRRLDEATSLGAIIEALALGAAAEAARVTILMVDDQTLRAWRHHGFAPGQAPRDLGVSASPILEAAVRLRQITPVPPSTDADDLTRPVFLRPLAGHSGLVMPLVVGKDVVALVYADGPEREGTDTGAPVWSEQVEVLVRHASARLENVTSQRTVEVLTSPA